MNELNNSEKHILKAISEIYPYSLPECIETYCFHSKSYDQTILAIDLACKTGMPVDCFSDAMRNALTYYPPQKQSLFRRFINWVKNIFK